MSTTSLADLLTPEQYRAGREHIFPGPSSLQWALRVHREDLIRSGALLLVSGRRMVNPPLFDAVILAAAQRAMAAKLVGIEA